MRIAASISSLVLVASIALPPVAFAAVNKDDGLTEAELSSLLSSKRDPAEPLINGVRITGEGCTLARLWIDISTSASVAPDSSEPTNVRMYDYTYFSATKKYGSPSQWEYLPDQYGYGYLPSIAYGVTPGQTNVHLLEVRDGDKSSWKLLSVKCDHGSLDAVLVTPKAPKSSSSVKSSSKSSMKLSRSSVKTSSKSSKRSSIGSSRKSSKSSSKSSRKSSVKYSKPAKSSSSSATSSVSMKTWKTYEEENGVFSIMLPREWKIISEYDGSYLDLDSSVLGEGMVSLGEPNGGNSIIVDFHTKSMVNTQGRSLMEFAEENMVFPIYFDLVSSKKESGWGVIEYEASTSTSVMRYKVLFNLGDAVVVLSFKSKDATAAAIISSFKAE